jgi:hypothetical protein
MDKVIIALFLGIMIGGAATGMYVHYVAQQKRLAEIEERNSEQQLEIDLLKEKLSKPGSVPYQTREEIEHAMAGLILFQSDLEYKQTVVQNISEHLKRARGNGRVRP